MNKKNYLRLKTAKSGAAGVFILPIIVIDEIWYLGVGYCLCLGFKPTRSLTENYNQIDTF